MAKSNVGLFARLEAKPGKETDLERLLVSALPLVDEEPFTVTWFVIRFGISSFAIFDTFEDEDGRADHLGGRVAALLGEKGPELLAQSPVIERIDILAAKLPTGQEGIEKKIA